MLRAGYLPLVNYFTRHFSTVITVACSKQMAEDADATTGAALIAQAEVYQQAIHREQSECFSTPTTVVRARSAPLEIDNLTLASGAFRWRHASP